jgi:hypothetical protein
MKQLRGLYAQTFFTFRTALVLLLLLLLLLLATFVEDTYNYIPDTNHVSRVYVVAAIE